MTDIEVFLDWQGNPHQVGTMRRRAARGGERVTFAYAGAWISSERGYEIDPTLPVGPGTFRPAPGHAVFSAVDLRGELLIAKFPKESDEYSLARWEAIALDLAEAAGIQAAAHDIREDGGRPIFVSRRFDRCGGQRIPFISALSMTEHRDGERGSYLEIVDALSSTPSKPPLSPCDGLTPTSTQRRCRRA